MPTLPVPPHLLQQALDAIATHGNATEASRVLGIPRGTLVNRARRAEEAGMVASPSRPPEYVVHHPPDEGLPIEELVERRKREFERKTKHEMARRLISVDVKLEGPIGILHFGDPHVDDDGTDIALLQAHADLVNRTEGLFAANVGDTTNNWVGRLAKLYAEQGTTASDAWRLAEWFIRLCPWLYIIGGNHDAWSGAGDPIKWISRQAGALYQSSEARLCLNLPGGSTVRINARHDFAGHSQWNPAHGSGKSFQIGYRDHINIAGHKHTSGYMVLKDPGDGHVGHCIQVASYKTFDRYARERGFRDQSFGPCALTTINPALPDTSADHIRVWWDPEAGADYLNHLRRKHS